MPFVSTKRNLLRSIFERFASTKCILFFLRFVEARRSLLLQKINTPMLLASFFQFWSILAGQICRPYSVFGTRDIVFTQNIGKTKVFVLFLRIGGGGPSWGGLWGSLGGLWESFGSPGCVFGASGGLPRGVLNAWTGSFFSENIILVTDLPVDQDVYRLT